MFGKVISNTVKQIGRSGWIAWASIGVMLLAFFIASFFVIIGFVSNLYIQYIETKPSMYVFFGREVPQDQIEILQREFQDIEEIQRIEYVSWEQAVIDYRNYTARVQSEITSAIKDDALPASLDIRLFSLEDTELVTNAIKDEVEQLNEEYGGTDVEPVVWIAQDKDKVDDLRQVFGTARIIGIAVFLVLMVVIFLFTLITVEFRTYNRSEEIGVMQLVGGSLLFIRLPYIFEGAFYGFMGALLSTGMLGLSYYILFVLNAESEFTEYVVKNVGKLPWPSWTQVGIVLAAIAKLLLGAFIGGVSSMIAIRRYVK